MAFLAPWFLLGGLALGLPVLFHLIRRSTRERTAFSSLMFLFQTPPRLTRRSRLEDLLLLCLRCLVLGLLALGFARPLFKHAVNAALPTDSHKVLVLVDSSASMRRANLWSDAREKVQSVLRQTKPGDQAALLTFDRQVNPLLSFAQWNAAGVGERVGLAMSKFGDAAPGWASTRLDAALLQAAETLSDAVGKSVNVPGEIVLISDLQEGSHLEQLQGYEWPKNVRVKIEPLKPQRAGNASLQLVPESDAAGPVPEGVRVRVNNAADSKREQFKVGWASPDQNRFVGAPLDIYVPPGQSRVLTLPIPPAEAELNRVLLQGDEQDFDNVAFTLPLERTRLAVLYYGEESESDPKNLLYFLQRAFQDTRHQSVQLRVHGPGAAVLPAEAEGAALVIVSEQLPEESARTLRSEVDRGKTLLFVLKNELMSPTLAALTGARDVRAEEAHPGNYAMLADIDFRNPLFAPFADARFADFTKIHFWKYRRLDPALLPEARVVAKFDSGDPALLEVPVGKGRVLVLTSGWQPDESQLALSTKFVPLLYSILETSGAPLAAPVAYRVGDSISLTPSSDLKVIKPDGSQASLTGTETNFSATVTPGIYTFASSGIAKRFAVNLDASESRTSPLSVEDFERLGVPLSRQVSTLTTAANAKSRLQNAELENRQKLWRWLLLLALAVLLVETWLGGRAARRAALPAGNLAETPQSEGVYR